MSVDGCGEAGLPDGFAGLLVERTEVAVDAAREQQAAGGGHDGGVQASRLLVAPHGVAGFGVDGVNAAHVFLARGYVVIQVGSVHVGRGRLVGEGQEVGAQVVERHEHRVAFRVVCGGGPVTAAEEGRADLVDFADFLDDDVFVDGHEARVVDVVDQVLFGRFLGPQEFAGFSVERPGDSGLAGDADVNLAAVTGSVRVDGHHAFGIRVRVDGADDVHHLERAFLVPVVARERLVAPGDLTGLRIDGKARVRAGERAARRATDGFRGGADGGGAVVDEVEVGVVGDVAPDAGHPARFERGAGPGFVAFFTFTGDEVVAPQFFTAVGVMAGHVAAEAGVLTGGAGDDYAVGDDRARAVGDEFVLTACGFPGDLAGSGVERHDGVVPGDEDDLVFVQRDGTLVLTERAEFGSGRQLAAVFPDEVTAGGVDGLDDVTRVP